MNTELLTRPWSSDRPRVKGYEPQIKSRITRVSRRRRNSWRSEILVNDCAMSMSHHDTKAEAEVSAAGMLRAYAEVHYVQV